MRNNKEIKHKLTNDTPTEETKIRCNERKKEGFEHMVHENDANLNNRQLFTILNTQSTKQEGQRIKAH